MPTARVSQDLEMYYELDDYTDPWCKPETILLLHGNNESSAAWYGWVPHLARHYVAVRPDMRGFGKSTPMPRNYSWTPDGLVDDYLGLMQILGIKRFHLVGAKVSQIIARRFAVRCPDQVQSLTLVGSLMTRFVFDAEQTAKRIAEYEKDGLEPWLRRTMSKRLGVHFPPEGVEWWVKLMARTPVSSEVGLLSSILKWDIMPDFARLACPTLAITDEGGVRGPIDEGRAMLPNAKFVALRGDSFHIAAGAADQCARETLDFISQLGAGTS